MVSIIVDNGQNMSQAWWQGIGTVRGGKKRKQFLWNTMGVVRLT